jgi:hypothetical protein
MHDVNKYLSGFRITDEQNLPSEIQCTLLTYLPRVVFKQTMNRVDWKGS